MKLSIIPDQIPRMNAWNFEPYINSILVQDVCGLPASVQTFLISSPWHLWQE